MTEFVKLCVCGRWLRLQVTGGTRLVYCPWCLQPTGPEWADRTDERAPHRAA